MPTPRPPWYREAFGPLYARIYAHRTDVDAAREAAFVVQQLALEPGSRVLDLACGHGRHLAALEAVGIPTWGIDLSRDLLAEARRRGRGGRLTQGDVRRLPFAGGSFDASVCFFTSFGYFADESEDRRVLREVARVLVPGGRFFLDVPNAAHLVARIEPRSVRRSHDLEIHEERRIEGRRVLKRVRVLDRAGSELANYEEAVRLYTQGELGDMARAARLEPVDWFGDFDGRAAEEGPRLLLCARRVP